MITECPRGRGDSSVSHSFLDIRSSFPPFPNITLQKAVTIQQEISVLPRMPYAQEKHETPSKREAAICVHKHKEDSISLQAVRAHHLGMPSDMIVTSVPQIERTGTGSGPTSLSPSPSRSPAPRCPAQTPGRLSYCLKACPGHLICHCQR